MVSKSRFATAGCLQQGDAMLMTIFSENVIFLVNLHLFCEN